MGNGEILRSEQKGQVVLDIEDEHLNKSKVVMRNVHYVPNMSMNLLSVSEITTQTPKQPKKMVTFVDDKCTVKDTFVIDSEYVACGRTKLYAEKNNKLYYIKGRGLDVTRWAEAVMAAIYVKNHCITQALPNRETPYEQSWNGPDLNRIKTWGCVAYAHVPAENRGAFDPKES